MTLSRKISIVSGISLIIMLFTACSGSGNGGDNGDGRNEELRKILYTEDFSFDNYKTTPDVPEVKIQKSDEKYQTEDGAIWYMYSDTDTSLVTDDIEIVDGYRIFVYQTHELEDAEKFRSNMMEVTNIKAIYIDFESPVFKIKVGDFEHLQNAEEINFRLKQIGYKNTRIIREKVKVYR